MVGIIIHILYSESESFLNIDISSQETLDSVNKGYLMSSAFLWQGLCEFVNLSEYEAKAYVSLVKEGPPQREG